NRAVKTQSGKAREASSRPVPTSHTRTFWSSDAVTRSRPSRENRASRQEPPCGNERRSLRVETSHRWAAFPKEKVTAERPSGEKGIRCGGKRGSEGGGV